MPQDAPRSVVSQKTALAIRAMFRNLTPLFKDASVAQLVEHHLAKVNVEGSNPFARSSFSPYPIHPPMPNHPAMILSV